MGQLGAGDIKFINCWVNTVPNNISYYHIEVESYKVETFLPFCDCQHQFLNKNILRLVVGQVELVEASMGSG